MGLIEGRHFEEVASAVGRSPGLQDRCKGLRSEAGEEWDRTILRLGGGCIGTTLPLTVTFLCSQAESKQAGQSVFRRGLLNRLQQEYQAREQLRARSLQGWVCYVTFICNIFDYLRVRPHQPPCVADVPVSPGH